MALSELLGALFFRHAAVVWPNLNWWQDMGDQGDAVSQAWLDLHFAVEVWPNRWQSHDCW